MLTARTAGRLAFVGTLSVFGCNSPVGGAADGRSQDTTDETRDLLDGMEDAEQAWRERRRRTSISVMSLDRMFPDRRVRDLADAAGRGRLERVEELLRAGVDPNARGTSRATPLWWAFRKGNLDGFVCLLESGADPNLTIGTNETTIMHAAIKSIDLRFLEAALAHGGDPDVREGNARWTPAFETVVATRPGDVRALQLLIAAGADLEVEDKFGNTVAMAADNRPDILYELLLSGADYRKTFPKGQTLLQKSSSFCANSRSRWETHCRKIADWLASEGVALPPPRDM